jgi:hypothetical protein
MLRRATWHPNPVPAAPQGRFRQNPALNPDELAPYLGSTSFRKQEARAEIKIG